MPGTKGPVSVSLASGSYAFVGPISNYYNTPEPTRDGNRYIAVGTNGSWYRHYHVHGKCWSQYSKNLRTEYPYLNRWFEDTEAYGCPTQVMLGPEHTFFVRVGSKYYYNLVGSWVRRQDFKMVHKLWLGFGGAYVIDRYDGSQEWDLKSYYGDLKKRIKKGIYGCQKIQDLAMNIENPACYTIIMANGASDYMDANQFSGSVWQKYMTENFGVRWRRRRE